MIGSQGENLIFLISQPRAGSTMMQRVIAGHSEVHATAEPWIMLHLIYGLKNEGIATHYNAKPARHALGDILAATPGGEGTYYEGIRMHATHLYNALLDGRDETRFLDKTPRYFLIIPELYRVFPRAKFVFLLRNPLAVLSSVLHTWTGDSLQKLSAHACDLFEGPRLLVEGSRSLGQDATVIRYEEFVQDPEEQTEQLFQDIGIEFQLAAVDYGNNDPPAGRMGDKKEVYKHSRPVSTKVDTWVDGLSTPMARYVGELLCDHLGEQLLERMGYPRGQLLERLRSVEVDGTELTSLEQDRIRNAVSSGWPLLPALSTQSSPDGHRRRSWRSLLRLLPNHR